MRIGELAARTGVSVHVLRVWERRYGLLTPNRSAGGYRLYGPQDEWRVRETARLREEGMPAAQAAATALLAFRELPHELLPESDVGLPGTAADGTGAEGVVRLRERLLTAISEFDGTAAQAILDIALDHLGVEAAITDLVMPTLHATGERWASGHFSVAQEHFASNLIRTRLSSLSLAWDAGTGPMAVLACPAGERHDLSPRTRQLRADRERDRRCHRSMHPRPQQPACAAQSEVSRCPDGGCTDIGGENRVRSGELIHDTRQMLWMDRALVIFAARETIELLPRFSIAAEGVVQVLAVPALR